MALKQSIFMIMKLALNYKHFPGFLTFLPTDISQRQAPFPIFSREMVRLSAANELVRCRSLNKGGKQSFRTVRPGEEFWVVLGGHEELVFR